MAALAGRSLNHVIFEANGKVKCTDISIPSTDFKIGKMKVLRLGNTNSFSISIQQTAGQRSFASKKTIPLKPHQFKLSVRPTKLTITFGYNKTALSIVEANETELKTLVDLLNTINEGKFSERKEISSRPNQRAEPSGTIQQSGSLGNDENQPLNSNFQKNTIASVQSSEANQFLSTKPDHNHSPSRLEPTNTHLGVKRKHTPYLSRGLNPFYGSKYSSPSGSVKKPFISPLQEKSATSDKSSIKSTAFYGTDSPATHGRKTIGLPKDHRRAQLSRDSNSFSFKAIVKPVFASNEVQLTGFSNLGNTCYMNAILQSLLNINSFAQDLCNRRLLDKIPTQCLYKCTYGLLACKKNNCQQDLQSLHLKKFKKAISQAATRFSGHLQHDAHEFLCQVLDQLKDDVNSLKPKSESDSTSESPVKEEISNQCPVRRTFECGVMHTITCKGCGESLNKEEIHHVFSLDLPTMSSDKNVSQVMKKLSIDKLIEDYFEEEELEYCCEECGCKEAVISHTFSRLPRVLILHLKRYDFNTYTDEHAKKQNDIQMNRFIDIGKLCNSKTTPPLDFKVEKVKLSPRMAKRPPSESQSDDDFVSSPTPKVRRKLHQDFNSTTPRKRKVQIIHDVPTDDESGHDSSNEKEVKNGTGKEVEEPPKSSELNFINDFDDIDDTSLEIETPKSNNVVDVINMSEQQQIEWAKIESLKSTSSNTSYDDCCEQSNTDVDCKKTERASTCNNSSRKVSRQSQSGKMGVNAGNMVGNTKDMDDGTGDMDGDTGDMDDGTGDMDDGTGDMDGDTGDMNGATGDMDGNTGDTGHTNGDIGHMDVDMDCSDEDLLTAYNDSHQQDNVSKDDETRDSEIHGLKGGVRIGDTKVSASVRQVTYISDDSDHSGLDTNKKSSTSSTQSCLVNTSDGSDTSFDEEGRVRKPSKDNSLCSLMDRRPVLSKFSGDLLIESDSNENTSRNNSRHFFSEKQFIKSVASPFNAKFKPSFKDGKSDSASKQPVESSPSSHLKRSSQTASKPTKNYRRTEVRDNRPKRDDVQPEFDEEEVPSSDEEQVQKAIELSIQESRMDYSYDQQDDSNDEKVPNVRQTGKALSPHRDLQNNSIDSGYQGDDDSVPYSYRLVSVVSHLGDKSFAGHYVSDVYDCAKDEWTSYDDLTATKVDEHRVRYGRSREGYIFFYLYKQCVEAVKGQSPDTRKSNK